MFLRRVDESPRNVRGSGQVSHLLLAQGDFGARHLAVTWVDCDPGSQQDIHAHAISEQAYVIIHGVGEMIVGDERRRVEPGSLVFIPPGQTHAIKNVGDDRLVYVSAASPPFPVEERSASSWLPVERSAN